MGAWHFTQNVPSCAVRLALAALVHREEDRIVGRLGVHALGPVVEVAHVAPGARGRREHLLA